jgi:hypothetical protein
MNTQNNAMPKEMISEHGTVRATNTTNRIPPILLAGEEFRKPRTDGTAIERANAKQLKHTTTDQARSLNATFDTSQLNFINSSFADESRSAFVVFSQDRTTA